MQELVRFPSKLRRFSRQKAKRKSAIYSSRCSVGNLSRALFPALWQIVNCASSSLESLLQFRPLPLRGGKKNKSSPKFRERAKTAGAKMELKIQVNGREINWPDERGSGELNKSSFTSPGIPLLPTNLQIVCKQSAPKIGIFISLAATFARVRFNFRTSAQALFPKATRERSIMHTRPEGGNEMGFLKNVWSPRSMPRTMYEMSN